MYDSPVFFQSLCEWGALGIRAGYPETLRQKNFCQTAHTDAADTDEVNVLFIFKIDFVHDDNSLLIHYTQFCAKRQMPKRESEK